MTPPDGASWLPADRYQLLNRLGAGGMGEVWLARDLVRNEVVAVKRLKLDDAAAAGEIEQDRLRFKREFIVLSKLNHPGIIRVHDAGELGSNLYYSMDYVAGWPLHEYFTGGKWTPAGSPTPMYHRTPAGLERVWALAKELLRILDYLHGQALVHRDLKPANLMEDESGQLRLIDFGLAKSAHLGLDLTRAGHMVGTLKYLAPEQIRGLPLDGRADLYAVGVILYLLTTGRAPFEGEFSTVVMKHLQEAPVPPGRHNPLISTEYQAIILRLLAKSPMDRFPSAQACALALERLAGPLPGADPTLTATLEFDLQAAPGLRPLLTAPLIGNDRAREEVLAACQRLLAGDGPAILLGGGAGSGKSRLAGEVRALAPEGRMFVWSGSARESGGPPGQLFQDVFAALAGELRRDPALLSGGLEGGGALAACFPALRGLPGFPDRCADARLDPDGERGALMAAFYGLFSRLAAGRPIALLLEDLHFADPLSLELASHLIGNFTGAAQDASPRLMVLATHRNDPASVSPVLARMLARLRSPHILKLELSPLEPAESSRLIQALLGIPAEPPVRFTQRLHALTGGNPFFLTETLNALVTGGRLRSRRSPLTGESEWDFEDWLRSVDTHDADAVPLPESLLAALQQRLADFDPPSLEALRAAALIGREFHFSWWLKISGQDEDALLETAEQAVRHGVLAESGGESFYFSQEAARAALLDGMMAVKKRRLHARIAALLVAEPSAQERHLELLTGHAIEGELPGPAVRFGHRLAGKMLQLYQTEPAARLLDRLSALFSETAPMTPETRLEHLRLSVMLYSLRNDSRTLAAAARQGIELAQRLHHQGAELEFWRRLAYAENLAADHAAALTAAETAFNIATATGDEIAAAQALFERATALRGLGRADAAQACHEDAYLRAASRRQFALCGNIVNSQGIARWESGDLTGAGKYFEKALLYAEKGGSPLVTATATGNGAEIAIYLGRLDAAEERLRQALQLNRELGLKPLMTDNLNNLGQCRLLRGDYAAAANFLGDALALAKEQEDRYLEAFTRLHQAGVRRGLGEAAAATTDAAAAIRIFQSIKNPSGETRARLLHGGLLLEAGRHADALAEAGAAAALAQAGGARDHQALAQSLAALARALRGEPVEDDAFAQALRLAVESQHLEAQLIVRLRHARALLAGRRPDEAALLLNEVARAAAAAGFSPHAAAAQALLAR